MDQYFYHKGVPNSGFKPTREATAAEKETLAGIGVIPAYLGKRFWQRVRCPVNGDGYWYTARYLVDESGNVVGRIADKNERSGPL